MNKLSHISLLVHNQDEACAFYTEKLGFVVVEGHRAPDNSWYWLTIAPTKESPIALTLMSPQTEEDKALVGKQSGSIPLLVLLTDDCYKTAAEFASNGIVFTKQPTAEFWGIDAVFKDLYGNLIDLCQQPEENQ